MSPIDTIRRLRSRFETGRLDPAEYRSERTRLLGRSPSSPNHLVVLEGAARQTHEIRQCEFQIGADPAAPDNDLVLGLPTLSGRHAVFRFDASGSWVKDLGSLNGTFVNGQRLESRSKMQLRPGDQVALSRELIFVFEGPRDEGSSEATPHSLSQADHEALLPTAASGGFRLVGGVILEPGEYVLAVQHVRPWAAKTVLLAAFAYVGVALAALLVVGIPLALWAHRKHHRGPGYLLRFYLTNKRAIESYERQYSNIWFEDLVDVYWKGQALNRALVAKDRPRFGLPGAVEKARADSQTIEFNPLDEQLGPVFHEILTAAQAARAPLAGRPPHPGPY